MTFACIIEAMHLISRPLQKVLTFSLWFTRECYKIYEPSIFITITCIPPVVHVLLLITNLLKIAIIINLHTIAFSQV